MILLIVYFFVSSILSDMKVNKQEKKIKLLEKELELYRK
jgi:hypothetical protein